MKFLIIDGNSIANRAYYGIRPLSNKKGVFTHATTGFFNTYLKLLKRHKPNHVAVAFDMRAPTFRKEIFDGYKATRKGMPDDLAVQMPYIKELLISLGISIIECEGYEADDIIGTISHAVDKCGGKCIIATGDRDSFQLISDNVYVDLAKTTDDVLYTPEVILEQFGLKPIQMIEVKALQGDSSDNIPGVAGIGEKTALTLIKKYNNIDYIYENIDTIDVTESVRKKLHAGKEMCYISHKLGTISLNAPISLVLSDYTLKGVDNVKAVNMLTELEIFSLIKKFNLDADNVEIKKPEKEDIQKTSIHENKDFYEVLSINDEIYISKNAETTLLERDKYKSFFESNDKKRTFDIKKLWSLGKTNNFSINNVVFDTTLAAYLLNVNSSEYGFKRLSAEYSVSYDEADNHSTLIALRELNDILTSKLSKEELSNILGMIEIPLAEVLVGMEQLGVELDTVGVKKFGEKLEKEIAETEETVFGLCGVKFNVSSPKQLGEVLFNHLGLPSGKKTKTGFSTSADVLEFLMDKHPVIPYISEYRALTKLNSTYVSGLLKVVGDDGRLHSTFKQTETRTGRISSAEPNIQNIPVRTERGKIMRSFFKAKEGYKLVDADYSQIELRVLSDISNDKIMQNAFINGTDIHQVTASQVFNQPVEWVTPEMRSSAKAVNFGIVYGIGAFSLSKDIGVSVSEANEYIKNYLDKYHSVRDYMNKTVADAKANGYVKTLLGRRRYIQEINSTNKNTEALGKRIAMNTPVQGTAADIIKIAMIKVYNRLKSSGLDAKLILQVHDELIVEAAENCTKEVEKILKEEMESAVKLSIPLTVDVKSGNTWFDTH